ncbi:hypothetical protein SADUNF_Sadunf06G0163400 [Salix dunnii]|uniref:Trichome birefringence-like C-terminal domain-containing protein n=1 Tax=Salix dunnii TaxID=1413687 RepID=A0A835MVW4_9ROSI|nr:hypothetical protein SADUNF_Sadunf06G0163400 [Salix dunnii]
MLKNRGVFRLSSSTIGLHVMFCIFKFSSAEHMAVAKGTLRSQMSRMMIRMSTTALEESIPRRKLSLPEDFRRVQKGRKDVENLNWLWQPEGCGMPRNGTWDGGGRCDIDRTRDKLHNAITDRVYNQIISVVIKEMDYGDRKVQFLNITHLTQSRYGHPSRHLEPGTPVDAPQDCSHCCLPGIPYME